MLVSFHQKIHHLRKDCVLVPIHQSWMTLHLCQSQLSHHFKDLHHRCLNFKDRLLHRFNRLSPTLLKLLDLEIKDNRSRHRCCHNRLCRTRSIFEGCHCWRPNHHHSIIQRLSAHPPCDHRILARVIHTFRSYLLKNY